MTVKVLLTPFLPLELFAKNLLYFYYFIYHNTCKHIRIPEEAIGTLFNNVWPSYLALHKLCIQQQQKNNIMLPMTLVQNWLQTCIIFSYLV